MDDIERLLGKSPSESHCTTRQLEKNKLCSAADELIDDVNFTSYVIFYLDGH